MDYQLKVEEDFLKNIIRWSEDWIEELELKDRDEKTINNYKTVIYNFQQFISQVRGLDFSQVNSKVILKFLKWREKNLDQSKKKKPTKISYWTKSNDIKVLKIFFKYIEDFNEDNFKFKMKWENIELKKPKVEKPHLSESEVKKIFNFINNSIKEENKPNEITYSRAMAFKLMFYGGLRASELCSLELSDFSEEYTNNNGIKFIDLEIEGKGGTLYTNPIVFENIKEEYNYFLENRGDFEELFKTKQGGNSNRNTIYDWMSYIYKYSNLEYLSGVHIIRHTFANRLADSGADLSEMQDLLRHSNPTTTRVYVKRNRKRMADAVSRL